MNSKYLGRACGWCDKTLKQKKNESDRRFNKRKYCDTKCRKDNNNYQAKLRA